MYEFLQQWQTLIAGFLAFAGAYITVKAIRYQIADDRERHLELRRRQFLAARAVLPADLSEICEYAELCGHVTEEALRHYDAHEDPPSDLVAPTLREDIPRNLQNLIEQLDERDAEKIADLLSSYQVQRSRLQGAIRDWGRREVRPILKVFSRDGIEDTLVETVRLRALADNIFDFARRKSPHITAIDTLTEERFMQSLQMIMGIGFPFDDKDEALVQHLRRVLVSKG